MPREELNKETFESLGIHPALLERLAALNFVHPTPIQFQAIPVVNKGQDVVGIAQTGSGKTLAFSLPMLQHVKTTGNTGLILLPTRELAVQVEETLHKIAGAIGVRTALVIGGVNPRPQIRRLKSRPDIIVATPGRLLDHADAGYVNLKHLGMLVLDEADRMLDMGFAPQLKRLMEFIPETRQTMLFSATMPEEIAKLTHDYMRTPVRVEVARPGTTADKIEQEFILVPRDKKLDVLKGLLKESKGSVLVFSRTKHGAKKIAHKLRQEGFKADEIHSNRSQHQRQKALKGFASGKIRIMVATDIAARGIDISSIKLVVNFDLPDQLDDYVHRIGRTGRAGREGKAISFATPDQKREIAQIQRLIKVIVPVKDHEGNELPTIEPATRGGGGRRQGGGRGRSGGGRRHGGRGRSNGRRQGGGNRNRSGKPRRSGGGGGGRPKRNNNRGRRK